MHYLDDGYSYLEMLEFLKVQHGYSISLSILKRWLRKKGIKHRPLFGICSCADLIEAVREELSGSGAAVALVLVIAECIYQFCQKDFFVNVMMSGL